MRKGSLVEAMLREGDMGTIAYERDNKFQYLKVEQNLRPGEFAFDSFGRRQHFGWRERAHPPL
jgi:hypothetical protein